MEKRGRIPSERAFFQDDKAIPHFARCSQIVITAWR
jgi:hypothetical protein